MATYNVLIPEKYTGSDNVVRTSYFNVGTAWDTKEGGGVSVRLAPGVTVSGGFLILPRKERGGGFADDGAQHASTQAGRDELDDEIPF